MSDSKITYTIEAIMTNRGIRYRVSIWCGKVLYSGNRDYEREQDAERAAKQTGATKRASKDRSGGGV